MECYTENTWVEVADGRGGLRRVPLACGCRAITADPMDESKNMKVECLCRHNRRKQATWGTASCLKRDKPYQNLSMIEAIKIYILQAGF